MLSFMTSSSLSCLWAGRTVHMTGSRVNVQNLMGLKTCDKGANGPRIKPANATHRLQITFVGIPPKKEMRRLVVNLQGNTRRTLGAHHEADVVGPGLLEIGR